MLTLDGTISDEYIALLLKLRKQLETVDKMANEDVPVKAKVPDIVAVMDAVDAVWRGPMSVSDRKTRYSVAQQLVWRLERIIEEPFKEYLQKVLSIHIAYSHIAHICQTSESSQFLFRPYSVTSVQAEVRPLRLNVTRCIITAVRRNMPFADNPRTTRNIAEVFKKSVTERLPHLAPGFTQESDGLILIVPKVVVHAPCALLNYLHRSRVPPFAYFGLSKSCCCACDIYFADYRHHSHLLCEPDFRGTEGEIRIPWVAPYMQAAVLTDLQDSQRRVLLGCVHQWFCTYSRGFVIREPLKSRETSES